MPIEIRELEINTSFGEPKPEQGNSSAADKELIIRECVEQVMLILKEKQEP